MQPLKCMTTISKVNMRVMLFLVAVMCKGSTFSQKLSSVIFTASLMAAGRSCRKEGWRAKFTSR